MVADVTESVAKLLVEFSKVLAARPATRRKILWICLPMTLVMVFGAATSTVWWDERVADGLQKGFVAVGAVTAILVAIAGASFLDPQQLKSETDQVLDKLRLERDQLTRRSPDAGTPNILDAIQLTLNQMAEYYTINKSQARNSFRFSVFAIIAGLATIVGGVWIFYFRQNPDKWLAALTAISGVLAEFIGAAYFYLYRKSSEQSQSLFRQLVSSQDTILAIRLAERISPPEKQAIVIEKIVAALLERSSFYYSTPLVSFVDEVRQGRVRAAEARGRSDGSTNGDGSDSVHADAG